MTETQIKWSSRRAEKKCVQIRELKNYLVDLSGNYLLRYHVLYSINSLNFL